MVMDNNDTQLDIFQIRAELRRIITEAMGADLSNVKGDVPLLEFVTSSLALVEAVRRVYDQFGVLLSIREVIEGQANLNALSVYVDQALRTEKKHARPVLEHEAQQKDQSRRQ